MLINRPIKYNLYIPDSKGSGKYEMEFKNEATFLQFGTDHTGCTTAVIETPDGFVRFCPIEHLKFIKI